MPEKFFKKRLSKIYEQISFYNYAIPEGEDRLNKLIEDGAPQDWTTAFAERIVKMKEEIKRLQQEEQDLINQINQLK